jgi:hypothetical protein
MLDLRDHPPRAVPGRRLVLKAAVADQRRVTGSAAWPREQILDLSFHHIIRWQPDRVAHTTAFQRLVERRQGERSVRRDHHGVPAPVVSINDEQQDLVPALRTVDVPGP